MIGKVALIADEEISSRHSDLLKDLVTFAVSVRTYIDHAPILSLRFLLSSPYYDHFRYETLKTIQPAYSDAIYQQTAIDIIKARPFKYLRDVWMNYCALWQVYELLTLEERHQLDAFVKTYNPAPYMPDHWKPETLLLSLQLPSAMVWILRICLCIVALSGMGFMMIAFKHTKNRSILVATMAALVVHGHYLLIALSQAGLPRYGFALWPAIVLGAIILPILLFKKREKS